MNTEALGTGMLYPSSRTLLEGRGFRHALTRAALWNAMLDAFLIQVLRQGLGPDQLDHLCNITYVCSMHRFTVL